MLASTYTPSLLLLLLLTLLTPNITSRAVLRNGETVKAASSEDTYRAMVYKQTQERIQMYNEMYSEYYTAGHTIFSELTLQEFSALYLGGGMSQPGSVSRTFVQGPSQEEKSSLTKETYGTTFNGVVSKAGLLNDVVPSVFNIDYSQAPNILITNVKDQGSCGSCWAFAGIGEIESYFIKNHNLYLDLSQQQMVDCLPAVQSGNLGCGGGYLDSVGYYSTLYPIAQEKYYPYTATQAPSCNNDRVSLGKTFQIHSYVYIYDCVTLANALLTLKPIGICGSIDAQWHTYVSGVVPSCGASVGGHCVLLVGGASDGTTNVNTNYWKIRNSWGVGWGEQGFIRLFRDYTDTQKGLCGFCTSAIYSI